MPTSSLQKYMILELSARWFVKMDSLAMQELDSSPEHGGPPS